MALNPEVLFPDEGAFCGVTGGAWYYPNFTSMGEHKQVCTITGMKVMPLGDFNENTMISAATGKKFVLCEAPNGVQFVISFYKNPNSTSIYAEYGFKYGNTYTWKDHISGGPYMNIAAAKTYGAKICLVTGYPQSSAVDGITKASSISFKLFLPIAMGQSLQSWAHINNGVYYVEYHNGNMINYDQPNALYYPDKTGQNLIETVFTYTNIADAVADINRINPSKPVTQQDIYKTVTPENPDAPQDTDPSNPGGGGGTYSPNNPLGQNDGTPGFDPKSDPIPAPSLPTGGSVATGSIKSFVVTPAIIQAMFQRLWNNSLFDVLTWQKLIEEPMDSIISLHCIPCTPASSGSGTIQLGNISTDVTAPIISSQYKQIDCGTINVKEFWGSALDYSPYTKIEIFIPGCGIRPIKPEDVMRQPVSVIYNMDVLTGNFTASVKCGISVLYKFTGNMKATIPITSRVYSALEAVMKGAGQSANAYANGAMSAANKEGATAESIDAGAAQTAGSAALSAAINVAMSKVNIQRSGDISGSTGLLDDFVPYLIIHRPIQSLPNDFKKFKGYPSNITAVLNTLKGYTEVEFIHLENISGATDEELNRINRALRAGVII